MVDAPPPDDDDSSWIRRIPRGFRARYHYPILGVLAAFMLWVRLQAHESFTVGGRVYFSGNDAYYHFREVMYVVSHYPSTMPFDPWSYFPYGTSQGQFGTLFDQLIATAALLVGAGSPTEQTVATVTLVAPAVFGAITLVPVYLLGARVADRRAGLTAAIVLALLPGAFLARTTVGFADHNSAEPFFQALALAATMVALQVAEREKPVVEQFLDRDWAGLRDPVVWAIAAGGAFFLYIMVWPPGLFLVGLFGAFLAISLSYDHYRGRSPEHVAIVGAVSMAVVLVLALLRLDDVSFSTTSVSLLHPVLALGVAAGSAFMIALSRYWEREGYPQWSFPATVGVLTIVVLVTVAVVLPDLFGALQRNALRIFAFGQTDTTLTIREAQAAPFDSLDSFLIAQYGLAFLTAATGLLWMFAHIYRSEDHSSVEILVAVWAIALTMMALTQVRFNYYLALSVAVLNGYFVAAALDLVGLRSLEDIPRVETYQVMVVLVVVLVAIVPLLPPIANPSVVGAAQQTGPGTSVVWGEGMDWLEGNTPPEGAYGGANNDLAYYGTYEETDDFAYPEGAYGVMSWWDYGHWITVLGHRIPNANPFQEGPRPSSAYFQSTNETHANLILEVLPSISDDRNAVVDMSTAELRDEVESQSAQQAHEETRYVAIDDQMAGGKFPAITQWAGPGTDAYFERSQYRLQGQNVTLPQTSRRYDQTMLARLYFRDASGLSHYRLVHEVDQYAMVGGYIRGQQVRTLTSISPPGWDWESAAPVESQLQRSYAAGRAVSLGQGSGQYVYNARVESRVKLYERVEGARLTGTVQDADNGTPVVAFVRMRTDTGRNFTYIQQTITRQDGSFRMTVPYATDEGVTVADGGTNSSVRAAGDYTVQVGTAAGQVASGTVRVPEEAVYDGREIEVTLEPAQQGNESSGSLAPPGRLAPAEP